MTPPLRSRRLLLPLLEPATMRLLADGALDAAAARLGGTIAADYPLNHMPLARRLRQLQADPAEAPWLLRGMVHADTNTLIGHIGFHSPPRPADLADVAPDGVELGYTVHPAYRRQGYAREAALALMHWAFTRHGQRSFVLSVSPANGPSTAMAASLGFVPCGSKIDEEDGLEIFSVRRFEQWPGDWPTPLS